MRRALVLVVVLLALGAADSRAATPVTLGPGVEPSVAVDSAGTAYIAWIGNESTTTTLHFCRLPRGASACAVNQQLTVPGTSLSRPFVDFDGTSVNVFTYRYGLSGPRFDAVYWLKSGDGGTTFGAPVEVGTNAFYDAVVGPGNGVSLIANNSGLYQRVPTDGSAMVTTEAHLADDHPYTPSVVNTGTAIIAVSADASGNPQFRIQQSGGDPNDATTWTPSQALPTLQSYLRLTSGPTGTFMLSDNASGNVVIQRFNGSGFDAAVAIPGPAHELTGGSKDIAEDASGRLHAVWPFGSADGTHIGYATSDDGTTWQVGTLEAGPDPSNVDQSPGEMHLSVAPDHLGVAVWQNSASAHQVLAMAVGPVAIPAPTIGKTTSAAPVSGTVLVKLKGKGKFVPLTAGRQVPLGSTFDTTKGTVALDTSAGAGKPLQHGEFNGGQFMVQQSRKNPLTTLSMTGGALNKCKARLPKGGAAKKPSRTLFSSVKGRFRSRGRNSSATVRGTKWTQTDSCAGTLTIVKQGSVAVRDFTLRKNKTLKTGQRYLARPPRIFQRRGNR